MAVGCRECVFFEDDPEALERTFPNILILSSTYGSARGDSGVCGRRGTFQAPEPPCAEFEPRRVTRG